MPPAAGSSLNSARRSIAAARSCTPGTLSARDQAPARRAGKPSVKGDGRAAEDGAGDADARAPPREGADRVALEQPLGRDRLVAGQVGEDEIGIAADRDRALAREAEPAGGKGGGGGDDHRGVEPAGER